MGAHVQALEHGGEPIHGVEQSLGLERSLTWRQMKQVLMTMFSFSAGAGGITRVLMNRGRMLREVGIDARIALFHWDPMLKATVSLLKRQGRLATDQPVLNVYTHYAAVADGTCSEHGESLPGSDVESSPDGHAKRETIDPYTNRKVLERFISPAGHCYLVKQFAADGEELARVELRDPRHSAPLAFKDMSDLYTHWLTELASSNTPCAIIADAPKSAPIVLNVRGEHVYRILTIHNNHYKAPYRYGAKLRGTYAGILRSFEAADALAVLTHQQRADIEREFGESQRIHVIPNSVTVFADGSEQMERDPLLVVSVARYHHQKGLSRIIAAFEKVVHRVPGARLELYGAGEAEAALRLRIAVRLLGHAVFLKGYAVDVAQVLRRASVAVCGSKFEGFGIGIAEALSQGTPVVSFDCAYGPAEIITDGEDGYLAEDEATLAESVIELLEDHAQARKMGEAGRRNMQRFSPASVTAKWLKLFHTLEAKAPASGQNLEHSPAKP